MPILVLVIPAGQHMANPVTAMHIHILLPVVKLAMIHNGIIENYAQLKNELVNKGYHFKSDTDTEVF